MLEINWLTSVTELLLVFVVASIFILYYQYRQRYKYWQQLGVKQLNPTFPVGDLSTAAIGLTSIYTRLQFMYNEFKKDNQKFGGIYYFKGPAFMPVAPDLIKQICIKDFSTFTDRGVYINGDEIPVSVHLFSMKGPDWRNLRTKLTPAFTTGKLKSLHKLMINNVEQLINNLKESKQRDIGIKEKLLRLGLDMIANIAFGIDCNTLKDPNDRFADMVDKIFNPPSWELLKLIVEEGLDNPGNIMKIFHVNKEVVQYFTNLVHETVEFRDKNHFVRDDLMQVLLKLRDTVGLSMEDIVAQCFIFFLAGYETTSATTSFAIHELAYAQQIQENLRKEIVENVGKDVSKFDYESIAKLPLLDKVVKETLRKYPIVPLIHREVGKPYTIPDTDIVLEPGTPVVIPVIALHRDPDLFPNPMKFDPERFNDENIDNIVPYSYIPFGDGPRNCIGNRLGLTQVKLSLSALLSNFRFYPGKGSQLDLELKPSTTSPVLSVKSAIPVKIVDV